MLTNTFVEVCSINQPVRLVYLLNTLYVVSRLLFGRNLTLWVEGNDLFPDIFAYQHFLPTAWWWKIDPVFGLQSGNPHFWIAHSKGFRMRYKRKSWQVPTHNIKFFSKFLVSCSWVITQYSAIFFSKKIFALSFCMKTVLIKFSSFHSVKSYGIGKFQHFRG